MARVRRAPRKRQTMLNFTSASSNVGARTSSPVGSASLPVRKEAPKELRDRKFAVVIDNRGWDRAGKGKGGLAEWIVPKGSTPENEEGGGMKEVVILSSDEENVLHQSGKQKEPAINFADDALKALPESSNRANGSIFPAINLSSNSDTEAISARKHKGKRSALLSSDDDSYPVTARKRIQRSEIAADDDENSGSEFQDVASPKDNKGKRPVRGEPNEDSGPEFEDAPPPKRGIRRRLIRGGPEKDSVPLPQKRIRIKDEFMNVDGDEDENWMDSFVPREKVKDKAKGKELTQPGPSNSVQRVGKEKDKRKGKERAQPGPSNTVQEVAKGKDKRKGRKLAQPGILNLTQKLVGDTPLSVIQLEKEIEDEKLKVTPARKNIAMAAQEQNQELNNDDETDDDIPISSKRRARYRKSPHYIMLSSADEDDAPITPVVQRRHRSVISQEKFKAADKTNNEENGDAEAENRRLLEEKDLEEDQELISTTPILDKRTRQHIGPKKSAYQAKLAELRAKRSGGPASVEEPKESPLFRPGSSDDDNENDEDEEDGDEDNEDEGDEDEDDHVKEDSLDPNNLDNDLASFVIPDSPSDLLGVPEDLQMPIEFTRLSHQSDKENFKTVCQFFVQLILNPFFNKESEIHQFAIRALDRKIGAYASSVLRSSIWKKHFVDALKARPRYRSGRTAAGGWCDACGITGREASVKVVLQGNKYDRQSFEDLDEDDDDDDDEDEDGGGLRRSSRESEDDEEEDGTKLKVFYLGRNCEGRAEMYHAFLHWKKQLWDYLRQTLEAMELDKATVEVLGVEEATKCVDDIFQSLKGDVETLYSDFKKSMAGAENNMKLQSQGKWR